MKLGSEGLTPEREELLLSLQEKWLRVGLSTEPADRPQAEQGVRLAYQAAGLRSPSSFFWLASPWQGALWALDFKRSAAMRVQFGHSVTSQLWELVDRAWTQTILKIANNLLNQVSQILSQELSYKVRTQVHSAIYAELYSRLRSHPNLELAYSSQHDAASLCELEFYHLTKLLNFSYLEGMWMVAQSCGWVWPFERVCLLIERPVELHFDNQGRIHCLDGPAVAYPDGWGVYAYRGIRVPARAILRPETLTPAMILSEPNAAARWAMMKLYPGGEERLLEEAHAQLIDEDKQAGLALFSWETRIPNLRRACQIDSPDVYTEDENEAIFPDDEEDDDEQIHIKPPTPFYRQVYARILRTRCPSTGRDYYLHVPPQINTAKEAIAWTFGLEAGEYNPLIET